MAAQHTQQNAMRMFQPGAGSHEANMQKLNPAQRSLATDMSTRFMDGIRAAVSAQMMTGMATTASSDTSAQPQEQESEAKAKQTSASNANGLGHAGSSQSMGNSSNTASSTASGTMDDPAVQQVMQGAMSGVYSQLYGIVNKMESTRQDKATLSNIASIYDQALASGKDPVKGVPQYNIDFDSKTGKLTVQYAGTKDMTKAELTAAKQKVSDTKDSMSEMSTMDQMTLQQAMEQKGQFESVFSNMLKTYQSTASGVIANMKD